MVTGGSDGEIIIWYMDSNRVNKRFFLPTSPHRQDTKRAGVCKLRFVEFPQRFVLLICGTDDGSIHFIHARTCAILHSIYHVVAEPIVG